MFIMRAWVIEKTGPLCPENFKLVTLPDPVPSVGEILIKVKACGVCHTDLDEVEGRVEPTFLPIIPGHQIVGEVVEIGEGVKGFKVGDRVGAGWIWSSCGRCEFCLRGLENLCPSFKGTGKDAHGGYAEYFLIKEDFAFPLPQGMEDKFLAPLFCAGSIGFRALKLAKVSEGATLGLLGFGASNHLVLKMAKALYPQIKIFVFTRSPKAKELAQSLGADFVGDLEEGREMSLDALIDTTPAWKPPFFALRYLKPGGRLIINAISKEEGDKDSLLVLSYQRDLWMEREIKSVANITREDIREFLYLAQRLNIKPDVEVYPFEEALQALLDIKNRKIKGAKVLIVS